MLLFVFILSKMLRKELPYDKVSLKDEVKGRKKDSMQRPRWPFDVQDGIFILFNTEQKN